MVRRSPDKNPPDSKQKPAYVVPDDVTRKTHLKMLASYSEAPPHLKMPNYSHTHFQRWSTKWSTFVEVVTTKSPI